MIRVLIVLVLLAEVGVQVKEESFPSSRITFSANAAAEDLESGEGVKTRRVVVSSCCLLFLADLWRNSGSLKGVNCEVSKRIS